MNALEQTNQNLRNEITQLNLQKQIIESGSIQAIFNPEDNNCIKKKSARLMFKGKGRCEFIFKIQFRKNFPYPPNLKAFIQYINIKQSNGVNYSTYPKKYYQ